MFYGISLNNLIKAIKKETKNIKLKEYSTKYSLIDIPTIPNYIVIAHVDFQSSEFFIEKNVLNCDVELDILNQNVLHRIMDEMPPNVKIGQDNLLPIIYLNTDTYKMLKLNPVKVIGFYKRHVCLKIEKMYTNITDEKSNDENEIFVLRSIHDEVAYNTVYMSSEKWSILSNQK